MARKGVSLSFDEVQRILRSEQEEKSWQEQRDENVKERIEIRRVQGKTPGQCRYLKAIETSAITLCTGPAGSGKTFIPTALGWQMLQEKRISKLVLTRPLVTCSGAGKGPGFLPGDLMEKVAPNMRPMLDVLGEVADANILRRAIESKTVEIIPLDYMRGLTLKNAVVVGDECQNAEYEQLRMLLTRLGTNARIIVSGDASQSDLEHSGPNPLLKSMRRLKHIREVSMVYLTHKDIVRHPLIQAIDVAMTKSDDIHDHLDNILVGNHEWYCLECPRCGSRVWYDNGDEDDMTIDDVCETSCWLCESILSVPENTGDPVLIRPCREHCAFTEGRRKPQ